MLEQIVLPQSVLGVRVTQARERLFEVPSGQRSGAR
jgi:hypothetical protein